MMEGEPDIVRILGEESFEKLRQTKCLLVGAGGIGCELLKDLVLMNFGEIHVVDLDTIDISNLNRQFLFRHKDIKKPKSTTAVNAVQHFSNSKLVAHQENIMDTTQFPLHWFSQFDIIFNALDNLAARRYVNKMSQLLSIPLLESGTSGYDGYIQPIIPGQTECFDCTAKETPKTFPVCTIRSTPSTPVHCVVWAKNFLFSQLFSASSSASEEPDTNDSNDWGTTNQEEINLIKAETNELHELQKIILSQDEERAPLIVEKLFVYDIQKLLQIESLWKKRVKPVPLDLTQFDLSLSEADQESLDLNSVWGIKLQVKRLLDITKKLMKRMPKEGNNIEFDKDDEDTLEFVATAANIRSHIFHIPMKSVFDIKQIAGNIIPAIATTNAIIAGLSSLISLRVLNLLKFSPLSKPTDLNMAFTSKASNLSNSRYLSNPKLAKPNCRCAVCSRVVRGIAYLSRDEMATMTLGKLINLVSTKYGYSEEDVAVLDTKSQRLLFDYDFEDLKEKKFADINVGDSSVLLITDEGEDANGFCRKPLELYLSTISSGNDSRTIKLPDLEIPLVKADNDDKAENEDNGSTSLDSKGPSEVIVILDEEGNNDKRKREREPDLTEENEESLKKLKVSSIDDETIEILD